MTRRLAVAWVLGVLAAGIAAGQTENQVKVIGQRINLRARADVQSEVVGQAADGDILVAKSFQDDWVEVAAPDAIDLWVQRDFLKENVVTASKLNIRAGAGINFTVVGNLGKGDVVTLRGDFGEWVKIAPTPGSSLWVNRAYVQVLQPEKAKPPVVEAPAKPAVAVSEPIAPSKPGEVVATATPGSVVMPSGAGARSVVTEKPGTPVTKVPPDLVLIPLEGQGRVVQRDGYLQLSGFVLRQPSRYRLVQQTGRRVDTICYVRGNSAQLGSFVGQRLLIRGREYWVKGVRHPVVVPEQIIPKAAP
jgi:hypothetical protein